MDLTLNKTREAINLLGKQSGFREPVFLYHGVDTDNIYYGDWIDKIMKTEYPYFDLEKQQGFLVPIKFKKQISELMSVNGKI